MIHRGTGSVTDWLVGCDPCASFLTIEELWSHVATGENGGD